MQLIMSAYAFRSNLRILMSITSKRESLRIGKSFVMTSREGALNNGIKRNLIRPAKQTPTKRIVLSNRSAHDLVSEQTNITDNLRPTQRNGLKQSPVVFQGDSTNKASYEKAGLGKNGNLVDIIITDPPYCLLERRRKGGDLRDPKSRQRKLDDQPTVPRFESVNAYKAFTNQWLPLAIQHMKPSGTLVIWTNALGKAPIISVAKSNGFEMIGEYLWAKRTTTDIKENSTKNEVLVRIYETALVFQPANMNDMKVTLKQDEKSIVWNVITGYHEVEDNISQPHPHPCHKPFAALEPLVRQWSKPGDLVFDPFAGSGGILTATAKIGGRHLLGMELLSEWVNLSNEAIQNAAKLENKL